MKKSSGLVHARQTFSQHWFIDLLLSDFTKKIWSIWKCLTIKIGENSFIRKLLTPFFKGVNKKNIINILKKGDKL